MDFQGRRPQRPRKLPAKLQPAETGTPGPSGALRRLSPQPAQPLEAAADAKRARVTSEATGADRDQEEEEEERGFELGDRAAAGAGSVRLMRLDEYAELAAKHRDTDMSKKTRRDYATELARFKKWCANGSVNGSLNSSALAYDLAGMTAEEIATTFYRYVKYRAEQGGVGATGSAKRVHSALQWHLNLCMFAQNMPRFDVRNMPPYSSAYKEYMGSDRSREKAEPARRHQAEDGYLGALFMEFNMGAYMAMATKLLASADLRDASKLARFLLQVALVARMDDLLPRTLCDLTLKLFTCIMPSQCWVLSFLQTAGKGVLRAKMPEVCPMGALFRWLCARFAILSHTLPLPSDADWASWFLWPGKSAGAPLANDTHADDLRGIFDEMGCHPRKLTHELRVFAAQMMHEAGVSLEVIQRIGHWLLDQTGTAYIVPGYTAEALLALGFWPGAAQKDYSLFWAERFHVAISDELVQLVMPGLSQLTAHAAACSNQHVAASSRNLELVLRMGAVVVVQDALELADKYPDNPVHGLLLKNSAFIHLRNSFKAFKALGNFEGSRPRTVKEMVASLQQQLQAVPLVGAGTVQMPAAALYSASSSSAALQRGGAGSSAAALQQGGAGSSAAAALTGGGSAAAAVRDLLASPMPSREQQIMQQQAHELPGQLATEATLDAELAQVALLPAAQQQAPPPPQQREEQQQSQEQRELRELLPFGATHLSTPSGARHTAADLAARAASTPGGHLLTGFHPELHTQPGMPGGQMQVLQQQPRAQPGMAPMQLAGQMQVLQQQPRAQPGMAPMQLAGQMQALGTELLQQMGPGAAPMGFLQPHGQDIAVGGLLQQVASAPALLGCMQTQNMAAGVAVLLANLTAKFDQCIAAASGSAGTAGSSGIAATAGSSGIATAGTGGMALAANGGAKRQQQQGSTAVGFPLLGSFTSFSAALEWWTKLWKDTGMTPQQLEGAARRGACSIHLPQKMASTLAAAPQAMDAAALMEAYILGPWPCLQHSADGSLPECPDAYGWRGPATKGSKKRWSELKQVLDMITAEQTASAGSSEQDAARRLDEKRAGKTVSQFHRQVHRASRATL